MKTYKFKYAKLVRDRIADHAKKDGAYVSQKILSENKYISELQKKLLEETKEFTKTRVREEMLEELSDVQEIIDNLLAALNYKGRDLKKIQAKKNQKNGSFKKKVYINYIKVNDNYSWLAYHLKNKDKYPLIK